MKRKYFPLVTAFILLLQSFSPLLAFIPTWVDDVGAQLVCDPEVNLVTNGGFETPVVTHAAGWDIYSNGTAGLSWGVTWRTAGPVTDRPETANLELHNGVGGWTPKVGQYAELDTDWFGPSNPTSQPSSVKISQGILTHPGYKYELKYSFSPRPGRPAEDNNLQVSWDGSVLSGGPAAVAGAGDTVWQEYTHLVETGIDADELTTELAFTDMGTENSLGTFLDEVSVKCLGPVATPTTSPTDVPEATATPTPTPTDDLSDVTVCKYDEKENPLPGWNLQLLGEKVESVPVLPDDVIGGSITPSYSSNLPEGDYVLLASGTYKYRGGTNLLTDPGYSERLVSDGFDGPYFPWINIMDLTTQGALGITVDGTPTDWGYFSPSHEYARGYLGHTGSFEFTSLDNNINDNIGSMNVDIYKGYSGITGDDGCVTFEDVAYSTYTVEETLMQDWENVEGKGDELVVENPTETVTLVNSQQQVELNPANLIAFKVVCSEEEFLPETPGAISDVLNDETVTAWVEENEKCDLAEDWDFQWGPSGAGNFNGFQTDTSELGDPWQTFGVGNPAEIDVEEVNGRIEVREVFPEEGDYVPFSNGSDVTAELFCTGDGQNNDNWEWITNPVAGETYYCVGFNALAEEEPLTGTISGHKWHDMNGNGLEDEEDETMKNWKIRLYQGDSGYTETWTDENGYYEFTDLEAGTYYLKESQKSGWAQTNLDLPEDKKLEVILEAGGSEVLDFFNARYGRISGYKVEDLDGDGDGRTQETNREPGVKNWRIYLWMETNDVEGLQTEGDNPDKQLKDLKTNQDGYYNFDKLLPGTYYLTEETKAGWIQTYPDPDEGGYFGPIELTSNGVSRRNDFANFRGGTILGRKYNDVNANGEFDQSERRDNSNKLDDWLITLYDENWDEVDSMLTGLGSLSKGQFKFTGLEMGTYYICEEDRDGWTQTQPDAEDGVSTEEFGIEGHAPYCFETEIGRSGDTDSGFWFGNSQFGMISGYKWNDEDGDGEWDDEELGLPDWTIMLWEGSDPLNGGSGNITRTVVTDKDGYYEFKNLQSGTYFVSELMEQGWVQKFPGGDTPFHTVNLDPGEEDEDNHFGNIEGRGSIRGLVWNDDNGNGSKDDGEPDLGDAEEVWKVELYNQVPGEGVLSIDSKEVDSDGNYLFKDFPLGTYYVKQVQQTPWEQTLPEQTPGYHVVNLTVPNQVVVRDFGNNVTPDISVTKSDGATNVQPGGTLTYTIVVKNVGTEKAFNVIVKDTLPTNVALENFEPEAQYDNINKKLTWTIAELAVNAEWEATVVVTVPDGAEVGEVIENTVLAYETCNQEQFEPTPGFSETFKAEAVFNLCEPDPDEENNTAVDTTTVGGEVASATVGDILGAADSNILGAADTLAMGGLSMWGPIAAGTSLLMALTLVNGKWLLHLRRKY